MERTLVDWLKSVLNIDTIAPENIASRAQWIEIVLMSMVFILLTWWVHPIDPSLAKLNFPWLWVVPVLIALRYGVLPGLVSATFMITNTWVAAQWGRLPGEFPTGTLFGGGLVVLLCGEFSNVWRDRNLRMEETYLYVTDRLARLTKRHLLLNLSHDRIEQEMLARPGSLRDALVHLRGIVLAANADGGKLPGANGTLQLLSQYVNVEAAAIYTLEDHEGTPVLGELVASRGDIEPLAAEDELFKLALESRNLAHISSSEVSLQRLTKQLVVAPLVAGTDELIGVLAVTRMPFFALTDENLQMTLVLLGYYADIIRATPLVQAIQSQHPTMPVLFSEECARMLRLEEKVAMPSHLVVLHFDGDRGEEIATNFLRIKRGLDLYWQTFVKDVPVLVVLLPFASDSAKDGFLDRLRGWLASNFKGDFISLNIGVHVISFNHADPMGKLAQILEPK
jgi:hypothetical protein